MSHQHPSYRCPFAFSWGTWLYQMPSPSPLLHGQHTVELRAAGGSRPHSRTLCGALHSIFLLHSQRQAIKSLKQLQLSCFTFGGFENIPGIKRRTQNQSNCPNIKPLLTRVYSIADPVAKEHRGSGARLSVPTSRALQ